MTVYSKRRSVCHARDGNRRRRRRIAREQSRPASRSEYQVCMTSRRRERARVSASLSHVGRVHSYDFDFGARSRSVCIVCDLPELRREVVLSGALPNSYLGANTCPMAVQFAYAKITQPLRPANLPFRTARVLNRVFVRAN